MALELHITIQEDSARWRAVRQVAETEHISPEQAAERLLDEAVEAHLSGKKTPAQELIGAFSSPEDVAAIDAAMAAVREHRHDYDRVRDFAE